MISERPKEYYSVTINRLLRNRECAKVTFAMMTMFGLNWVDPNYTVMKCNTLKKGCGQWSLDKELHLLSVQFKHETRQYHSLSNSDMSKNYDRKYEI